MTDAPPASPLLAWPGAVNAEITGGAVGRLDVGVAGHYGDPLREQRAALAGAGLVDRSNRDLVRVGGSDRHSWLNSLLSQALVSLAPYAPTEALLLSPHGHVEQHVGVLDDGAAVWLDTEPGQGAALVAFLERMRFLLDVTVAHCTSEWAQLAVIGPRAAEVVESGVGTAATAALPDGGWVREAGSATLPRLDLVVNRSDLAPTAARLREAGAVPTGLDAYDALRVHAREPRAGQDTDERTIPHEVGWLDRAVHLDKGCYRGQETVARVHNLGRPPRRLVLLHLDGSEVDLPAAGSPLLDPAGRTLGRLGTAARHHELGPIALGLVKRNVEPGTTLSAAGVPARLDPDEQVESEQRRVRPQLQRF